MIKKTFKIQGMHCTSCALMIESDLEDMGITSCCSYAKQTLEVEFEEGKVNEEEIEKVVVKSGYMVVH